MTAYLAAGQVSGGLSFFGLNVAAWTVIVFLVGFIAGMLVHKKF